jgi:hypothetical protein
MLTIPQILLVVFIAWHYALRCGYISDDHAAIEQRVDIIPDTEKNPTKEPYWIKVFNDGLVMYFMTRMMWKLGCRKIPAAWHAVVLGIHILNVYFMIKVLTPLIGFESAKIAGLLWGVHPMLNQNVVWISGRPYTVATCMVLVAMLYWNQPFIVLPLYLLAVITNISIIFVPVLIKLFHPSWQANVYIVFMLIGGVFVAWKFKRRFESSLVLDRENFKFKRRRLNALARIYNYYVSALTIPDKMGWYHEAGFRYNERWEKFNYQAVLGYLFLFWLTTKGAFGWWFILGILPNANLYATNSFVQDRYLYFGSIAFAALVAPMFLTHPVLLIATVSIFGSISYRYSRQLKDDESTYRENWRNHPKSDYAINNLSYFLIQQHRYEEARSIIMRGLDISNGNKMLWYNLGVTWAATGNFRNDEGRFRFLRAVDCWKQCLALEPRWAKPAEDLKKLLQLLVDNKVITMDASQAASTTPVVEGPATVEGTNGRDKIEEARVASS